MVKDGIYLSGRYQVLSKIGAGGMADVYKAKDCMLNRYVAVKVLKKEYREDENFVKKFRSEAQAAAGLLNPNVVAFAIPKSVTFTFPSLEMIIFCGLISLCMM